MRTFKQYISEGLDEGKLFKTVKLLNDLGLAVEFDKDNNPKRYTYTSRPKNIDLWTIEINRDRIEVSPSVKLKRVYNDAASTNNLNADKMAHVSKELTNAAKQFEFIRKRLEPLTKPNPFK